MTPRAWVYAAAILAVLAGYALLDFVQSPRAADEVALRGNFAAEHEIGRRFRIDPASLPPPNLQRSVRNGPRAVAYAGQRLNVPPGFTATPFATGIRNPRRLLVLPNGDVLVATQSEGDVLLLRDDGSGRAASRERYAGGFNGPYGLAWRDGALLVADQDGIWRVPSPGARSEPVTARGVFGAARGHANRPIAIDPRSGALFAGVGSMGNIAVEPEPKATIQHFGPDGSNQTSYAAGTRNPTVLAVHPQTGELWAGVQERDGLGDNLPSDYLIRVRQGGFYGWPYAYIGPHPQPGFAERAPDKVAATIVPDLLFQAHSSLLDLVFYEGAQFPAAVPRRGLRGAEGLVEPLAADRVQNRLRAVSERPAGRVLRKLRDRVLGLGRTARRGLGPPGGAGSGEGRRAAGRRRYRRHDLADCVSRRAVTGFTL